jgi:tetratricopeptide (TPR) repeat protein
MLQPLLEEAPRNLRLLNLAGLAYTGKGDPKQADQYFESALKISPDFVPALKNLAINEASLGQIGNARKHLNSALEQAPDDPVANLYLGELSYRQQDFKQAAEHLHRAGDLVSRNPNLLASLAVSELKLENRQESTGLLADLPPTALTAQSQFAVGIALAEAGLPDPAIRYLEAARASNPSAVDITYDLALCYMSVKRYPDAISLLQNLSTSGQETSEIDNLLAEAFEANHETQHAVDILRRAIALSPEEDDNYLEFASICLDHQAFEDAGKVLKVGLTVHPKSARLLFERGILNAMQDHFDLAEQDFKASADLDPENNSAYIGLGITFLQTGNATQAIQVLRTRLQDRPDDANLCYLLGEAILRAGAQDGDPALTEAQTLLQKAIRIDNKLVEPRISLGTIYLRHERVEDAVTQFEQARRLDPKAKSAYSHLAVAYRRLGQQDKAREVLRELKDLNDRERTGSRQPVKSQGSAPSSPVNSSSSGLSSKLY